MPLANVKTTNAGAETLDPAQKVIRHFRAISDQWHDRYERPPQRMSDLDLQLRLQNACQLIKQSTAGRTRPVRLLDIGCGGGTITRTLPTEYYETLGVDRVPEMIIAAARANPGRSFCVADAEHLPVATGSFDVVVSLGVLEYLTNPCKALNEVCRILASNGLLILSIPNRECLFRQCSWAWRSTYETVKSLLPRFSATAKFDSEQRPYQHTEWSLPHMRTLLTDAGFTAIDTRFNTYGPWGRLGQTKLAMDFSRWMTSKLAQDEMLSRPLAWTAVLLAQKTETNKAA